MSFKLSVNKAIMILLKKGILLGCPCDNIYYEEKEFTDHIQTQEHINGIEHLEKTNKVIKKVHCDVCNVNVNNIDDHNNTKGHKNKIINADGEKWSCDICNSKPMKMSNKYKHIQTQTHLAKLEGRSPQRKKINVQQFTCECGQVVAERSRELHMASENHKNRMKKKIEGSQFTCEECGVTQAMSTKTKHVGSNTCKNKARKRMENAEI